jgi:hypothetical protein
MIKLSSLTLGKVLAELNFLQKMEDARRRKALTRMIRLIREEESE